jgi:hypothetical protein
MSARSRRGKWARGAIAALITGAALALGSCDGTAPADERGGAPGVAVLVRAGGCGQVDCVAGWHCRTATVFGVVTPQCVPDDERTTFAGCACVPGFHCENEASGAEVCVADPPPPPAPPGCETVTCAAGTTCRIFLVFGAPVAACAP